MSKLPTALMLCASFRSSDCVLVVGLAAVGGHQGAVEGIHLIALMVPHPEPGKDNDVQIHSKAYELRISCIVI